jgi:drug/metabolite transporter (DMT)-like permease
MFSMKKALINLHIAVFLAGFTGVLGRWITLNESLLVWYRLLITVLTLFIIAAISRNWLKPSKGSLLKIFGVGALVAFHWVSFYGSIKYSNVSVALVCFSTLGFFSSLLEPLIMRKRFMVAEVLLGLLAILGVYLIFHFDTHYQTGIIYGLVSAVLAALFTILNKSLLKHNDAKTISFYELAGGFVVLSVALPFYLKIFDLSFALPAGWDWFWLLVLSWVCTILAFYLSMTALHKVSPFTVNLTYNLEPVYGIIMAFIIYQENKLLGPGFYAGLLLICIAVTLQMLRVYRQEKRKVSLAGTV